MDQKIVRVVLAAAVPKETPDGQVQALLDTAEIDIYLEDLPRLFETFRNLDANARV